MLRQTVGVLAVVAAMSLSHPALAGLSTLEAAITGGYYIDELNGFWFSPAYTTGIQDPFGQETRGLVAFDVRSLPPGTIDSAVLSLENPYSENEVGGPLELRLYGLPGMNWSNYTGSSFINASNFNFIGSTATPLWGTTFVAPVSWPGSTVSFTLPTDALNALRDAANGDSLYHGDFFAFGLRVVKAEAEEPKPRQYVFGGTSAGGTTVQLSVEVTPVPEPGGWALSLAAFGLAGARRVGCRRASSNGRKKPLACTLVAGVLICLIAAGVAPAATLTQSFSRTLQLGDNLPEGQDTASFMVDRFDSGLGHLTGVAFTLASDFTGGAVFYHPTLSLDFTYVPRHYLAVEMDELPSSPTLILDHTLPALSYSDTTPGGGSYWEPEAREHFEQVLIVPPEDLAQFVGEAPFALTVTLEDRSLYAASSPLAYINDKYVISSLVLTVDYTYVPVPEPTTPAIWLALLSCPSLIARPLARSRGLV